jgi:hypothetical protein
MIGATHHTRTQIRCGDADVENRWHFHADSGGASYCAMGVDSGSDWILVDLCVRVSVWTDPLCHVLPSSCAALCACVAMFIAHRYIDVSIPSLLLVFFFCPSFFFYFSLVLFQLRT